MLALSNYTKEDDHVTLTVTFVLKLAFSDFVVDVGIVFHKQIFFPLNFCMYLDCFCQKTSIFTKHILFYLICKDVHV